MPIISKHPWQLYRAFLQHCFSKEATCFTNTPFVFLDATTTDSRLFQLDFSSFICSADEVMVVLACSRIFRNRSVIWNLLKDLWVSPVCTAGITSVKRNVTIIKIAKSFSWIDSAELSKTWPHSCIAYGLRYLCDVASSSSSFPP